MNRNSFRLAALAGVALISLVACASAPEPAPNEVVQPAASAPVEVSDVPTPFALAMQTADTLSQAGNEQAAIDRLTQLLGNPALSEAERADTLLARAKLRYGAGNDVFGAIEDFDEMLALAPQHPDAVEADEMRSIARGEATSLNFALQNGNLSRTETFETLFRLGYHQEALDQMLEHDLTPDNDYLIDFYQMGYLCEGTDLTGPGYDAVEPDGTQRTLRHCDFGK